MKSEPPSHWSYIVIARFLVTVVFRNIVSDTEILWFLTPIQHHVGNSRPSRQRRLQPQRGPRNDWGYVAHGSGRATDLGLGPRGAGEQPHRFAFDQRQRQRGSDRRPAVYGDCAADGHGEQHPIGPLRRCDGARRTPATHRRHGPKRPRKDTLCCGRHLRSLSVRDTTSDSRMKLC